MTPVLLDQRDLRRVVSQRRDARSRHGTFLVWRSEGFDWCDWRFVVRRHDCILHSKSYADAAGARSGLADYAAELGLVPVYQSDVAGVLEVEP
jgi:hypothetical protein